MEAWVLGSVGHWEAVLGRFSVHSDNGLGWLPPPEPGLPGLGWKVFHTTQ